MRNWNPYAMEGVDNGVAVYGSEGMVQIGGRAGKSGFKVFDRKGQEVLFDNTNETHTPVISLIVYAAARRRTPRSSWATSRLPTRIWPTSSRAPAAG
jgi:hypothetical protein